MKFIFSRSQEIKMNFSKQMITLLQCIQSEQFEHTTYILPIECENV